MFYQGRHQPLNREFQLKRYYTTRFYGYESVIAKKPCVNWPNRPPPMPVSVATPLSSSSSSSYAKPKLATMANEYIIGRDVTVKVGAGWSSDRMGL